MQIFNYGSNPGAGLNVLIARLQSELNSGQRVLWFLTGGSGIHLCKQAMDQLTDEQSQKLTVALGDERFGPPGHADSNWQQLNAIGFNPKSAKAVNVLRTDLQDMYAAAEQYAVILQDLLSDNDVVVGQYGMGPDGHIAGILPGSPAVHADGLVTAYKTADFERITTTFAAITQCNVAFLFASGAEKRPALERLQQTVPLDVQPAQILKHLPESFVFNDQIGETV